MEKKQKKEKVEKKGKEKLKVVEGVKRKQMYMFIV